MPGPILTAVLGPLTNAIGTIIDRVIPDKHAAEIAKIELERELLRSSIQGELAQLDINKIEAANPKTFVSGWRPFIGWVGGTGFAVQFVFVPLVGYLYALTGNTAPPPLALDPILYQVILGLLGLSIGTRTYEKIKSVAAK